MKSSSDRPAFTTVATQSFDRPVAGARAAQRPGAPAQGAATPVKRPETPQHIYPPITQLMGSFTWEPKFRDTFAGSPALGPKESRSPRALGLADRLPDWERAKPSPLLFRPLTSFYPTAGLLPHPQGNHRAEPWSGRFPLHGASDPRPFRLMDHHPAHLSAHHRAHHSYSHLTSCSAAEAFSK